jgi:hypothetical protein
LFVSLISSSRVFGFLNYCIAGLEEYTGIPCRVDRNERQRLQTHMQKDVELVCKYRLGILQDALFLEFSTTFHLQACRYRKSLSATVCERTLPLFLFKI